MPAKAKKVAPKKNTAKPAKKEPKTAPAATVSNKRTRSSKGVVDVQTKKLKTNNNAAKTIKKTVETPKKVVTKKEAKLQEKNDKKINKKTANSKENNKEAAKIEDKKKDKKNKKEIADGVVAPIQDSVKDEKEPVKNVVAIKKCT
jgi:hypothetical protein